VPRELSKPESPAVTALLRLNAGLRALLRTGDKLSDGSGSGSGSGCSGGSASSTISRGECSLLWRSVKNAATAA
jgi:hypothetical protein